MLVMMKEVIVTGMMTDSFDDEWDVSFTSQSANDSIYLPTPQRQFKNSLSRVTANKLCFMNLSQLDKFMEQVNSIRSCITPQCSGILIPVHVRFTGLGGAISVSYTCSGCASHSALFETSSKYELTNTSEISVAVQVAFIVAGQVVPMPHIGRP